MDQLKFVRLRKTLLSLAIAAIGTQAHASPNYGEALQKSIYFYEAQQAGELPAWNRVEWRGDTTPDDGADNGVDLTGGWFDAGDHVKFGLPMAASATMLAWGVIENPAAYTQSGQMVHIKNNLRFVADYFVNAHPAPHVLYGQVGTGSSDHAWWGPAEVMHATSGAASTRPSYAITESCPGSDLAGETAAALAAIAMVFASDDPTYSATLLTHAEQLYDFAKNFQGKYSDCITDAQSFYNSWSGYQDELVWSAAWLYKATGNNTYLTNAKTDYNQLGTEGQSSNKSYKWTQAWDDKSYGSYVLLAQLTGESQYRADAERWLDYWSTGYNGEQVPYTAGGLAQLDQWGANRYAANTAWVALVYSDYLKSIEPSNSRINSYYNFATSQLEYLLGDNPMGHPYQIGLTSSGPLNPHHRTAHGSWADNISTPVQSRHLLIGALVGGPASGDSYTDDRTDYVANEVATDYNAGFTSALARLYLDFGGSPIAESEFPPAEVRDTEFFVEAKVNASGPRFVELATQVHNRSAWPARISNALTMRYWVDLSSEIAAGYAATDVTVSTAYSQASAISQLTSWGDPSDNIYYVDISFAGINIFPGGQSDEKKEVQFRLSLPTNTNDSDWDNSDDPSWDNYTSALIDAPKIALYDAGVLVWGTEPTPACGADTGINCIPSATATSTTTPYETAVSISLSGSDEDGSINGYQLDTAPSHGSVTITASSADYTPASGYFGSDSFTYVVVDDQGASSTPAIVSITVEEPIVPAVSISSPVDGSDIIQGSDFVLSFDMSNVDSVEIQLNGGVVASANASGAVTLTAPSTTGSFTVSLTGLDESGTATGASATLTLNAIVAPPNSAPVAAFSVSNSFLNINLDASASTDDDGDTLTYQWDLGDGNSASGVTSNYSYSTAGSYDITLTVSDGEDSDTSTQSVTVAEAQPGSFDCSIGTIDEWNTGAVFNDIVVTNLGDSAAAWTVVLPVNGATSIANSWGASVALSGSDIIATGGSLAAGASYSFGFQLAHDGNFSSGGCNDASGTTGTDTGTDTGTGTETGDTGTAACSFTIEDEWNTGYTGRVDLTNTGSSNIDGWAVSWSFTDGSTMTSGWNASFSGSDPITAIPVSWNSSIAPGATVSFGFQGDKGSSGAPSVTVTGDICQ